MRGFSNIYIYIIIIYIYIYIQQPASMVKGILADCSWLLKSLLSILCPSSTFLKSIEVNIVIYPSKGCALNSYKAICILDSVYIHVYIYITFIVAQNF